MVPLSPGGGEELFFRSPRPHLGERSSLLWFPSPLWGEGSGEGTLEAMTRHIMRLYQSNR